MITIYHLGRSQSDRIVWLMEELGLPYRLEWFDRGPDRLAPPEYVALQGIGQEQNLIGRVAQRRTEGLFKQMNDHLGNDGYLAGPDFTLADVMSGFAVTTLPALGGRTFEDLPNIQRYAQRLKQRPAWQKAMVIAGPEAQRPAR